MRDVDDPSKSQIQPALLQQQFTLAASASVFAIRLPGIGQALRRPRSRGFAAVQLAATVPLVAESFASGARSRFCAACRQRLKIEVRFSVHGLRRDSRPSLASPHSGKIQHVII